MKISIGTLPKMTCSSSTQAVAVCLNPKGDVVIRQERHWNDDEDPYVIIPAAACQKLIEKLQALMDGAKSP